MRAFADALDAVPMALAENSGLSPIETLANIKSRQAKEKNTRLGVDCMQTGSNGKLNLLLVDLGRFNFSPRHLHLWLASAALFVYTDIVHLHCGTPSEPRRYAAPWCRRVQASSASTGCSAVPPRNNTSLRIQRCNHEWR
jgi:hypothetical protein